MIRVADGRGALTGTASAGSSEFHSLPGGFRIRTAEGRGTETGASSSSVPAGAEVATRTILVPVCDTAAIRCDGGAVMITQ